MNPQKIAVRACRPNLAPKPFEVLIGEWRTTGSHPYFPGLTLSGRAIFEWAEGGAFMVMRSEFEHPDFPQGIELFGSDDGLNKYYMLHFDERGVSRKYDVSFESGVLNWYRNDPEFSQRFSLTIEEDGHTMTSVGEMSQKGGPWEKDLSVTYVRVSG